MGTFTDDWQAWQRASDRKRREIVAQRPVCPDCEHDAHKGPCLHMSQAGWCPCAPAQ